MADERSASSGTILITGGRLIDPASGLDATGDLLIADGRIAAIETKPGRISRPQTTPQAQVIDAEGLIVCPGLIDPHVHLREPDETGRHEETIASGAAAAISGGFTTICCMPNTRPPLDTLDMVRLVHERAAQADLARVFVVACATKGRGGRELSDALVDTSKRRNVQTSKRPKTARPTPRGVAAALFGRLEVSTFGRFDVWPVGFSDDGDAVADAAVMRAALAACREAGRCFMQHCQEPSLTRGSSMNAGEIALRLGEIGWPAIAEELILQRDIMLNRDLGARYHAQHLSTGESAAILRAARAKGQPVTGEVSPHHLLLTEENVAETSIGPAFFKMNPPLRTQQDVVQLKEAVADGTITILATDHAPHPLATKTIEFARASFGIVGLDCALPLYVKALIEGGVVDWPRLIAMMTIEPAMLCGLDRLGLGTLGAGGRGSPADVTIIDPSMEWRIDAAQFRSAGRNCPFDDWNVRGRAVAAIVGGRLRMARDPLPDLQPR